MEELKLMFKELVAQRLAAAPESLAKTELIEELGENLYCRYADLLNAGVECGEAKEQAVDALGDTDELVEYLKGLEPDQPLPEMVLDPEKPDGGQIEEILHNVEDILRGAFHKAKRAFHEVKDTVKEGLDREEESCEEAEVVAEESQDAEGWKITYHSKKGKDVEIDADSIKSSVKDMMKDIEKVIRDAADVAKDACKTAKETAEKVCVQTEPVETDGPVDAAQLRGIDVQTWGGEITVRMSQEPDGDVLVGGDIEDLEVFRTESGVLTIRPVKTETSSFFFGRGIFDSSSSADVVLDLPCRNWELLKMSTNGGDVELEGVCPVDEIVIATVSGDVRGALPTCGRLVCKTTNGDIRWTGDASDCRVESVSGDVQFRGEADKVSAKTTSGDLTLEGGICAASVKTVSGDVRLRSHVMPDKVDVVTTSGDMWVDIPDAGAFTAQFRSISGDFTSDFFTGRMGGRSCVFNYRGGGEREYQFSSVSGDVEIRKYR